jgi:hypothetical protein
MRLSCSAKLRYKDLAQPIFNVEALLTHLNLQDSRFVFLRVLCG